MFSMLRVLVDEILVPILRVSEMMVNNITTILCQFDLNTNVRNSIEVNIISSFLKSTKYVFSYVLPKFSCSIYMQVDTAQVQS